MEFIKILSCLVKNTYDELKFSPEVLLEVLWEFNEYDNLMGDYKNIIITDKQLIFKYYLNLNSEFDIRYVKMPEKISIPPNNKIVIYTKRFTINIYFSKTYVSFTIETEKKKELIKIGSNNDLINGLYYSLIEYTLKNKHRRNDFGKGILSDLREYDKRRYLASKQLSKQLKSSK